MPNDLPDWYISQTPNITTAAGSLHNAPPYTEELMASFTPSQYLVYGWALSGVFLGTSVGATDGTLELRLKDDVGGIWLVGMITIATAIPSNWGMVYTSPLRPGGLMTSGKWRTILYATFDGAAANFDASYLLLFA